MKLRVWQVAVLVSALTACKKDNSTPDTTPGTESNAALIAKSAWKFDHAGLDFDGNGTIDANMPAGTLKSCETDNTVTFNINGTGVADEGGSKCNGSSPQSASFTWKFKNDESFINVSSNVMAGMSGDVKLLGVSKTSMSLEKMMNLGSNVNVIVVLKH